MANEAETLKVATKGAGRAASLWLKEIERASRIERDWRDRAAELVARYRGEKAGAAKKLAIFYSNVELLKPRVYSQTPAADVRRRRIHEDEATMRTGRRVALLMERALAH